MVLFLLLLATMGGQWLRKLHIRCLQESTLSTLIGYFMQSHSCRSRIRGGAVPAWHPRQVLQDEFSSEQLRGPVHDPPPALDHLPGGLQH